MTVQDLYIKLKLLGISEDRYYLNGLYGSTSDDDRLALTIKREDYTICYETYYKERGEKHSIVKFSTENEACQYLYKRLLENKEIEDRYSK